MTAIYRELITALRDAYSSMAANNLSDIMKFLTAITLVISIPTMIASFYGMNFQNIPMFDNPYGFIIITVFSIILAILIAMWMKRKRFL